jgi:hypothetical protein
MINEPTKNWLEVAWNRKPWVLLRKWGSLVLFAFKGQFVLEIKNHIYRDLVLHVAYEPFKRPPKTVICEMVML